jgi:hypothetical protein
VYTIESIKALFADLKCEATLVLLFLKSVRTIELLELLPGHSQPQLLFSISIAPHAAAGTDGQALQLLLQQRALFLQAAVATEEEAVMGTYQMDIIAWYVPLPKSSPFVLLTVHFERILVAPPMCWWAVPAAPPAQIC